MKRIFSVLMVLVILVAALVPAALAAPKKADMDIVDTAIADGRFTTLVTAVQAAGLVDTLKGPGPFTVFAPTDDAFKALPAGTLEALLADKAALTNVLLYHVVAGKVMAADVVNLTSADTVSGKKVTVKVTDGKVMINDAQVIITDIQTSNGVIHVIDKVLIPPADAPAALPQTGGEQSGFSIMALLALGLALMIGGIAIRRVSNQPVIK